MNIGVIKKEQRDDKEYLTMLLRPPFMESCRFSVFPNEHKKNANEPDLNIWYNFSRKGEKYRSTKVGAIWKKMSRDGKTEYFSGHIENMLMPTGKMYLTIYKAKVLANETAEDITWTHDIVWNPPKQNSSYNNTQGNSYAPPVEYGENSDGTKYEVQRQTISSDEASLYM